MTSFTKNFKFKGRYICLVLIVVALALNVCLWSSVFTGWTTTTTTTQNAAEPETTTSARPLVTIERQQPQQKPEPRQQKQRRTIDHVRGAMTGGQPPFTDGLAEIETNGVKTSSSSSVDSCGLMVLLADGPTESVGDEMFQYASFLASAAANGKRAVVAEQQTPLSLYRHFSPSLPRKNLSELQPERLQRIDELNCCVFRHQVSPCGENAGFAGRRRSWRYFHPRRDLVVKEFEFRAEIAGRCRRNFTKLFADYDLEPRSCLAVGVHVHTGAANVGVRNPARFEFDEKAFLKEAFKYFRAEYRDEWGCVAFVVVGTDPTWNRNNLAQSAKLGFQKTLDKVLLADTGDQLTDMCLLAMCNHTIFTSDTVGWWSAYLTGGMAVYPKVYREFLAKSSEYNVNDYFLPEWVAL